MGEVGRPAPRPCESCPYRLDVPGGIWAREEYEKLAAYDRPTQQQPTGVFLCHQHGRGSRARACAGWAGCHDGHHLLALRIAAISGHMSPEDLRATMEYVSPVPLFRCGEEAARNGVARVAAPTEDAVRMADKIARVRCSRAS